MAPAAEIKAAVVTQQDTAEVETVPLRKLLDEHSMLGPHDGRGAQPDRLGPRGRGDGGGTRWERGWGATTPASSRPSNAIAVTRRPFAEGDRVCGLAHGADQPTNQVQPEDGAFAEYGVDKGDPTCR